MKIKDYCTGVQHIGVPTNDIEKTIAFYESLGFTTINRETNGEELVAFLQMYNLVIETYQNHQATLRNGAVDHIAIDVHDIEPLFALAKEQGYEILEGINFLPFWEKGIRYFIIAGPNREKIEFCERLK